MALNFAKKAGSPAATKKDEPPFKPGHQTPADKPANNVKFLMRGDKAKKATAREEARVEEAKALSNKMRRFYLKEGETRSITFLDGVLDADGMLDAVAFYQHSVMVNGRYEQYVCTAEEDQTQPCPICASNKEGSRPSLVYALTVCNHTPYTIQKGPNQGKVIANQRQLYVCTRATYQILTTMAAKRGGLQGCTFDVSRTGEKEPKTGNLFDFVHKFGQRSEIAAKYGIPIEETQPADYAEEIVYRTPEELIELGVGKAHGGGFEGGGGYSKNLADQL